MDILGFRVSFQRGKLVTASNKKRQTRPRLPLSFKPHGLNHQVPTLKKITTNSP